MNRRNLFAVVMVALVSMGVSKTAMSMDVPVMDAKSQATYDTVMAFMGAMGNGCPLAVPCDVYR